ncbi:hypothetical protein BLNAU_17602 [Blattamonas nauphoetae]|uniref:CCHC-type domain-containing protein n=1 Tax=Blattamonas nauphoetae TaxID=2049346 RepID=A0ABQ9X6X0_9EUKA|nr:hypothetical protein BLNAU_17602 [Blattamonas nauphoetae]
MADSTNSLIESDFAGQRSIQSTSSFDYSRSSYFAHSPDTDLFSSTNPSVISALSQAGNSVIDGYFQQSGVSSLSFDTHPQTAFQPTISSSISASIGLSQFSSLSSFSRSPTSFDSFEEPHYFYSPLSFSDGIEKNNGFNQPSGLQYSLSGMGFEHDDLSQNTKLLFSAQPVVSGGDDAVFHSNFDNDAASGLSEPKYQFIDMSGANVIDTDELARQRRKKKKKRTRAQHSHQIEPIHRDSQEARLILAAINSTAIADDNDTPQERKDVERASPLSVSATTFVHRGENREEGRSSPLPKLQTAKAISLITKGSDGNSGIPPGFIQHPNARKTQHSAPTPYIPPHSAPAPIYQHDQSPLQLISFVAEEDDFFSNPKPTLVVNGQIPKFTPPPAQFNPSYPSPPSLPPKPSPFTPASSLTPSGLSLSLSPSQSQAATKKPFFGQKNAATQPTVRCFRCGKPGHNFDMCPLNQTESLKSGTRVDKNCCYKCGKPGHHSRDCPNEDIRVCFYCKQTGHVMKECPKKRGHMPLDLGAGIPGLAGFKLDAPSFIPSSTRKG